MNISDTQARYFNPRSQVFHEEYPLSRRLFRGHGVLQDLRILGEPGKLDHVAPHVLCQHVVKAVPLQDLEGVVSISYCREFKAVVVLVVVAQQSLEEFLVLEEMLEEPELANLEDDNALAPLFNVDGAGFHESSRFQMGYSIYSFMQIFSLARLIVKMTHMTYFAAIRKYDEKGYLNRTLISFGRQRYGKRPRIGL
jgi:hypothetical protein